MPISISSMEFSANRENFSSLSPALFSLSSLFLSLPLFPAVSLALTARAVDRSSWQPSDESTVAPRWMDCGLARLNRQSRSQCTRGREAERVSTYVWFCLSSSAVCSFVFASFTSSLSLSIAPGISPTVRVNGACVLYPVFCPDCRKGRSWSQPLTVTLWSDCTFPTLAAGKLLTREKRNQEQARCAARSNGSTRFARDRSIACTRYFGNYADVCLLAWRLRARVSTACNSDVNGQARSRARKCIKLSFGFGLASLINS